MNRIDNPYNIHALYGYYNPWEAGLPCPLYCGLSALPPTQLKLPVSASGASYDAQIVNINIAYSQDVTADVSKVCTTEGTFFTYAGSALGDALAEGMYQLRIEVGGLEYWGYPYCAQGNYEASSPILNVSPASSGAGNYTHNYSITNETEGWAYSYEYNIGTGWVQFGQAEGTITQDDWGASGTVTGYIRLSGHRGNYSAYRLYAINFNTAIPTLIIPQYEGEGGYGADGLGYIQWSNSSDMQGLGLYYAGGYYQRFYFSAEEGFALPVVEESFIENGEAGLVFESAILSERINMDFYPAPPHAALALSAIRVHDNIRAVSLWVGATESGLVDFQFTPQQVAGSLCQAGSFSWQRNRQYVGGCQEDYTTQSCP